MKIVNWITEHDLDQTDEEIVGPGGLLVAADQAFVERAMEVES